LIGCLALLIFQNIATAQDDPFYLPKITFVDQFKNRIYDFSDEFAKTFSQAMVDAMMGNRKVRIIHFGDSHIQADIFTDHVRRSLSRMMHGSSGPRGLVFPFNLAQSNNPSNYKVTSSNYWETRKSTKVLQPDHFGIFGITIQTTDSLISLEIQQTDTTLDPFNRIQLWYGLEGSATLQIDGSEKGTPLTEAADTIAEINLCDYLQCIKIVIQQTGTFTIYGLMLTNDLPGVEYINIGLNGATASSYNRSINFSRHLQRLSPDFVFVSLGTNDAYNPNFNEHWFSDEFRKFITNIKQSAYRAPILITSPNDHQRKGSLIFQKSELVHQVLIATAKSERLALWDFYEVMGGAGSIDRWVSDSLASVDKIHLNTRGYGFQASLFFQSLLLLFDEWISISSD